MHTPVVYLLSVDVDRAFSSFCDVSHLTAWVPGLRKALVVIPGEPGFPLEVKYEFAESRTYSLVYAYDMTDRVVRFTPGVGARDAVTGTARFTPRGDGCELAYRLEFGAARGPRENELGDAERLVSAFASFVRARR